MNRPWMRLYIEVLHDAKVQKLPPPLFKVWINILLCAAEHDGVLPAFDDLAFELRETGRGLEAAITNLRAAGLLDYDEESESFTPHNWAARQYQTAAKGSERAETGAYGNHRRWHLDTGKPSQTCRYCIAEGVAIAIAVSDEAVAKPVAERVARSDTDQTQIRTDTDSDSEPLPFEPPTRKVSKVTEADLDRLQQQFPSLNVRKTWSVCQDWLRSKGQTKVDYVAFLRNWLRKEQDRAQTIGHPAQRNSRGGQPAPDDLVAGWDKYAAAKG